MEESYVEESINPYRAPDSAAVLADETRAVVLANRWRRFGTLLVDYLCYMLCAAVVGVLIALVFGEAGLAAIERMPDIVLGSILLVAYYLVFEGLWGRTPGKWLFGTAVVNELGGKPTLQQVLGRTLCRLIPFEPFSFFGDRGWHDSLSNTQVVLVR